MNLPSFPGWHLLFRSRYDRCGLWLLCHGTEAALVEIVPGTTVRRVQRALERLGGPVLRFVTSTHRHCDHHDWAAWRQLRAAYPTATFIDPAGGLRPTCRTLHLSGEPLHLLRVSKHSPSDQLVCFRGVVLSADVELGTAWSCNSEVPDHTKRRSMGWLAGWTERAGYHVHTTHSSHGNDLRTGVNWPELFAV
jgi:hypothetical protein